MSYINELRELVGHRALITVGAAVLLTDAHGRLLLGLRADNHCWGIPGGSAEPGECLEETARRETREETGLLVGGLALYDVFSGPEFFYTYPNGDQCHNVSVVYQTSVYSGLLRGDPEHLEWGFFSPSALPEPISPPIRAILRQWSLGRRESV